MSKMLKVVGASWLQTKISSYILGILGIMAILALFAGHFERSQEDGNYAATIFYSEKTGYRIEYWGQSNELAEIPKGVARAYFRMDIDTTGWSLLEVETDGSYPDEIQAYAAGIVEGALTWHLIHTHLQNTIRAKCDNQPLEKQCDKLRDTLEKSAKIWKTRADEKSSADPFWHQVSLHYTQINGIFTGWEHGVERSRNKYDTDISDLYWLNSMAEVTEIQRKLNITLEDSNFDSLPGLSSAFLKIVNKTLEDGTTSKKLFLAQNAAGNYSSMTRILKRYKFNYHHTSNDTNLVPGISVDFAGYPGSVTSQDEFYIVRGKDHKLAVSGTALKNYNNNLWKDVNVTEEVPTGPRITAANHLASNVSSWGHILATSNSGTASKQWLVVDFNKLGSLKTHTKKNSRRKTIKTDRVTEITLSETTKHTVVHRSSSGRPSGLVWLVEQVPSRTHSADLTETLLEQGYLATYGLPYFSDIADITHISQMESQYGDIFSKARSPRANTFKLSNKNATTMNSILRLMRRNNMTDGNSTRTCTSEDQALCERQYYSVLGVRGDIISAHNKAYGVIDTKIVSGTTHSDTLDFIAISSPPYTETSHKNSTDTLINKGNVASTYTDQFDDELNFNGLKIRDLVKQQQEEAEQESKELHDREIIKPFQWSESDFKDNIHEGLPDKWEFGPYEPEWFW